jgi:hypothetical protein
VNYEIDNFSKWPKLKSSEIYDPLLLSITNLVKKPEEIWQNLDEIVTLQTTCNWIEENKKLIFICDLSEYKNMREPVHILFHS